MDNFKHFQNDPVSSPVTNTILLMISVIAAGMVDNIFILLVLFIVIGGAISTEGSLIIGTILWMLLSPFDILLKSLIILMSFFLLIIQDYTNDWYITTNMIELVVIISLSTSAYMFYTND